MADELRSLIADTLAAHRVVIEDVRGGWTWFCERDQDARQPVYTLWSEAFEQVTAHQTDMVLAALNGPILPEGGQTREEWGVWWHADSEDGIVLTAYHQRSREDAQRIGEAGIGDYGIRGFTLVRRTHTRYPTGDWSTDWLCVGEPWWRPVESKASDGR